MTTDAEVARLRTELQLTRQRNTELWNEVQQLRRQLGLPVNQVVIPEPPKVVEVKVDRSLLPPPEPVLESQIPKRRRNPLPVYRGSKPLRTQWPIEE